MLSHHTLIVNVRNAVYFSDQKTDPTQMCSLVQVSNVFRAFER